MSMTDCSKTFFVLPQDIRGEFLLIYQPYQVFVECQSFVGDGEREETLCLTLFHAAATPTTNPNMYI